MLHCLLRRQDQSQDIEVELAVEVRLGDLLDRQELIDPGAIDHDVEPPECRLSLREEPRDIGRLAIFLASDDSRYIIGQTIVCDGGQSAIIPLTGDFRAKRDIQWGMGYVQGLSPRE